MSDEPLYFYEHARQSYGALPLRDDAQYEWIVTGRAWPC